MKKTIKKLIPKSVFAALQPYYHSLVALIGTIRYGFPAKKLYVIGVTGTKGKSSVAELLSAILEEAGHTTALINTIRIKVADDSKPNMFKMSMPGPMHLQRFLKRAVDEDCGYVIMEMTSEGAKLNRHHYIPLDALIFTNLSPEHIESHGSFDAYRNAKLTLRDALITSDKTSKIVVANIDDESGALFLDAPGCTRVPFTLKDAEPHAVNERGGLLTFKGTSIHTPLVGIFNIYNILAAATFAHARGIALEHIKAAVEKTAVIQGRVESVDEGQDFTAIVDYAHTADSLEKLYKAYDGRSRVCVLGSCGGGRDTWKRPEMAKIAAEYCREVILTNEDPYDEDPMAIVKEMANAIPEKKPSIILDRRKAIREALKRAKTRDVVLITGKGTDPYIMGPNDEKTPWSDRAVVEEELRTLLKKDEE